MTTYLPTYKEDQIQFLRLQCCEYTLSRIIKRVNLGLYATDIKSTYKLIIINNNLRKGLKPVSTLKIVRTFFSYILFARKLFMFVFDYVEQKQGFRNAFMNA